MKYPKPLMTTKEMRAMGWSDMDLRIAARHKLAYHYLIMSPKGGKFKWDTDEFEKYRRNVLR